MRALIETYRGYTIHNRSNIRADRKVNYQYKNMNYHMPRKFLWRSESTAELKQYIDALYDRSSIFAGKVEKDGLVTNLVYDDPPEGFHQVAISSTLLLAAVMGEMPIEVPANGHIRLKTGEGSFVPDLLPAELISTGMVDAFHEAVLKWVEEGKPINLKESIDPKKHRDIMMQCAPSFNLQCAQREGKGVYTKVGDAHKPKPPVETVISSSGDELDLEVISLASVEGQRSYFIKRLYRNDQLLSLHTSWHANGPWEEPHAEVG